ncbi:MAG: DUF3857 domain-containing protein [Bacteroidetes bacterium]|nr:DUF3857 domain-containing protein [Bacteroidota bacterium]
MFLTRTSYLLAIIMILFAVSLRGQEYAVTGVSEPLKNKADAVVRFHRTEFIIKDIGFATTKVSGAITVLNEKGALQASIVVPFNKFTKVNDIEAQLYDSKGEKVKRLKRSEIENYSTNTGDNSVDDSYAKVALLKHTSYPYTVAFSYEYTNKNMMFYPTWAAILNNLERTSVEKSEFIVATPKGFSFRYLEKNMPTKVAISHLDDKDIYTWSVSNIPAVEKEPFAPDLDNYLPMVYTAPNAFEVENYQGQLTSWNDLGKFYAELNKDRYQLTPQAIQAVKEKAKGITNTSQKVQAVYEYLQSHTRYMNISLGIGGWQSMKAADVATRGFGDCKALTTYMKAMLKEVGVTSYPVLVKAGDDEADILTQFPSFQFNHVFLCVPDQKDTLWLECTSQTNPFGYLGSFTEARHALLVTESGGVLIKTPTYSQQQNQLIRHAFVKLKDTAEGEVHITTTYTGLQQEYPQYVVHSLTAEDQKRWLQKNLSFPSAEISHFEFKEQKAAVPKVEEKVTLLVRNLCTKSGSRMFVTPNLLNKSSNTFIATSERIYDFETAMNYADSDSIVIEIPSNYNIEFLPTEAQVSSKFGNYTATFKATGNQIVYLRKMSASKQRFPPSEYSAWVEFRRKIAKFDKAQIVLVAKQ